MHSLKTVIIHHIPIFFWLLLGTWMSTVGTAQSKVPADNLAPPLPANPYVHEGITPEQAAGAITLPPGFSAKLFAGEPDVQQPIAMTIDDRGRIWVAEAYAYPRRAPEGKGRDRILIFEDADGDHHFDRRTVFYEGLNLVSGLEVGFGGVWVGAAPYLMFIPDADGDDRPDSPPQKLLDGWGYQDTHETLNAFMWGPDGWLYGCHGVFTHSKVGKPGTPDDQRVPFNAGVWRYHPTRHEFEAFAQGTSNPWGVDFNDQGQAILTACVIPHLYHMIQGGRYQRQGGTHFNPYTYDDIKTIADHAHYAGNIADHAWWDRDKAVHDNSTDTAGGGHAHAGAMIYLGGNWPTAFRSQVLMNNIHGARLNRDQLVAQGSGYMGQHQPDFLFANDRASQIINLRYGPDGQVTLIDWYDMQQCHRGESSAHDRSNGRIFRIVYQDAPSVQVNLKQRTDLELVELQLHQNDWYVRHARRLLQERADAGILGPSIYQGLVQMALEHADGTRRLRGLWALAVTGGLNQGVILRGLAHEDPYVRAWTIQLATEQKQPSQTTLAAFNKLATSDPAPVVRLYLASALQRLPLEDRWEVLAGLLSHPEDATDHNLPLMDWYATEPLVAADMRRALALAGTSQIPRVREFILRRIADIGSAEAVAMLVESLGKADSAEEQSQFLAAINTALHGRRSFPMPAPWPAVYTQLATSNNKGLRSQARALAVTFGDASAQDAMRDLARDPSAETAQRIAAIKSLLGVKDPKLTAVLQSLVVDKQVGPTALRGLAAYTDPKTSAVILHAYPALDTGARRAAIATLASRAEYALALLQAVETGQVDKTDLSADILRQLGNLKNPRVRQRLTAVWGIVRESTADKKKLIDRYKALITKSGPEPDIEFGRALFIKTCMQCHKLFGTGTTIGPELTGSNRANLDYLLSNVGDPSAVMAKEYQSTILQTDSGRIITGIIKKQDDRAVTIVTATETITLPREEIEEMQLSEQSMMPDNQWQTMSGHEIRSLVAYLASPHQVPILATTENANQLFNGRDLTGWSGDKTLWKVEQGEIVGRSPGIQENQFLVSDLVVTDFELSLKVRLIPDGANSGIQFRSQIAHGGHVKGYQADIGQGWWGALYDELGRGVLSKPPASTEFLKVGQWNDYRIVATGDHIRTFINGQACVDLHDPNGARRGILALQIHSGEAMEIRFKDLELRIVEP
ncbi:MAG: PVC-type heme-binding CxxCH protein [Pirellulales bacterium]